MDIGALFGQATQAIGNAANDAWGQVQTQGLPALAGYVESQAIGILQADQTKNQAAVQQAVTANLQKPSAPNSFSAYMANTLQNPILKQYGPYVLGGIAAVAVVAIVLSRS